MKKLLCICLFPLAIACNSGTDHNEDHTDSTSIIDPNAVTNDIPMRTTDTATNIMKDTVDTIK